MENTTLVSKGSRDFWGTFLLQVMDVKDALCDADNPTVASVRVVNRLFQLGVKMEPSAAISLFHSQIDLDLVSLVGIKRDSSPLIATNCLFVVWRKK